MVLWNVVLLHLKLKYCKDKLGNNVPVLDADLMNKKFVIVENDKKIFSN
ncbi:hypothetical protein ACEW7V_00385 [Areca yellow leaf disease phytoplasma]